MLSCHVWWHRSIIPTHRKQVDCQKSETNLVYREVVGKSGLHSKTLSLNHLLQFTNTLLSKDGLYHDIATRVTLQHMLFPDLTHLN